MFNRVVLYVLILSCLLGNNHRSDCFSLPSVLKRNFKSLRNAVHISADCFKVSQSLLFQLLFQVISFPYLFEISSVVRECSAVVNKFFILNSVKHSWCLVLCVGGKTSPRALSKVCVSTLIKVLLDHFIYLVNSFARRLWQCWIVQDCQWTISIHRDCYFQFLRYILCCQIYLPVYMFYGLRIYLPVYLFYGLRIYSPDYLFYGLRNLFICLLYFCFCLCFTLYFCRRMTCPMFVFYPKNIYSIQKSHEINFGSFLIWTQGNIVGFDIV